MIAPASSRLAATLVLAAWLLGACALPGTAVDPAPPARPATAAPSPEAQAATTQLAALMRQHTVVLLGEVHDNGEGHRLRAAALEQAVAEGWRPAIVLEQFDRENQALLDRAQAQCKDADCVIALASPGKTGWDWTLYRPVIDLALRNKLPMRAGNLSRADAARLVKAGTDAVFSQAEQRALGLTDVTPELLAAQQTEVADSHCGMLPASLLPNMARAQIARDAVMAQVMRAAAPRPVVLLAGNGHVREDLGVPRWLPAGPLLSVGFVERPPAVAKYGRQIVVPAAARPDPCAAFKRG